MCMRAGWGTGDGFQALATLDLAFNALGGTLPSTWGTGSPVGVPVLRFMNASHNLMTGTLPTAWGSVPLPLNGLDVGNNTFTGARPGGWQGTPVHVCAACLQPCAPRALAWAAWQEGTVLWPVQA